MNEALIQRPVDPAAQSLAILCERRIGRPVLAATRIRVGTPDGSRTHALALSHGVLWWAELHRWPTRLGPVPAWRSLAIASEPCRLGGYRFELSAPSTGELLIGIIHGPGVDRLLEQLTAEQFARINTWPTGGP